MIPEVNIYFIRVSVLEGVSVDMSFSYRQKPYALVCLCSVTTTTCITPSDQDDAAKMNENLTTMPISH